MKIIIMLMIIFLFICIIGIICCFMLIYRNNKVYNFRITILNKDIKLFEKLPSYGTMLFKFWKPLTEEEWIKKDKL